MLLVIDVGNTNIVAGVFDGKSLVSHWRFSTDRSKTADEYGILLRSMFNYTKMPMDEVRQLLFRALYRRLLCLCATCASAILTRCPWLLAPALKPAFP